MQRFFTKLPAIGNQNNKKHNSNAQNRTMKNNANSVKNCSH
jgi:hypothetical protein